MSDVEHIDRETAVTALRKAAFRIDDPDDNDYGRILVHCFLGGIGCHWDLDDAIRLTGKAAEMAWVDSIVAHDLAVLADGKVYQFDVPAPSRETAA